MPSYGAVSFHAQQAAEKALKAFLIRHQVEFSKTHDLGEILQLAESAVPGIAQRLVDTEALTPYAVETRYPADEPPIDREDASRHLMMARKVLGTVTALLKSYLDAGRPGG
jgi:HEPN domain-containing protein